MWRIVVLGPLGLLAAFTIYGLVATLQDMPSQPARPAVVAADPRTATPKALAESHAPGTAVVGSSAVSAAVRPAAESPPTPFGRFARACGIGALLGLVLGALALSLLDRGAAGAIGGAVLGALLGGVAGAFGLEAGFTRWLLEPVAGLVIGSFLPGIFAPESSVARALGGLVGLIGGLVGVDTTGGALLIGLAVAALGILSTVIGAVVKALSPD